MIPENYPLALYRGDSERWQFRIWLDAGKTQPADLSGVTASAQIRERPGGAYITELECSITDNIIDVALTSDKARALPASGAWDLQLSYLGGDVRTVFAGAVSVRGDVTDTD